MCIRDRLWIPLSLLFTAFSPALLALSLLWLVVFWIHDGLMLWPLLQLLERDRRRGHARIARALGV